MKMEIAIRIKVKRKKEKNRFCIKDRLKPLLMLWEEDGTKNY